ncbi:hypothetical protein Agub_g718 [Astrephomene gubernaculifera]|uniref:RING-type domain-containing protein n=1 Tax=Astrephomene gubernaculifera TaxID=47775 RepID=A0AAD3HGX0_9CHLO|nr:hypothetical protein Agub_g718 [Astrephomene gubernaculifera]
MECSVSASASLQFNLQDDDIALAKLLQEQERAFYILGQSISADQTGEVELTDEELARRLQEEEDQATYHALAYGVGGDADGLLREAGLDTESPAQIESEEQEQSELPFSYEDMLALGDLAGKVSKGLKAETLNRLQVERVSTLRATCNASSLDRCCICQLEFEDDDEATPLPCRHCYHSDCVRQWLQQSKACPVCGKELEAAASST